MKRIIKVLNELEDFCSLPGVNDFEITDAESRLKLNFSKEYKDYLKEYALVSGDGHELTGICKSKRLNVVDVTIEEKKKNNLIPKDFYVVEKLDIDNIIIWQNEKGLIFESIDGREHKLIYSSLTDYLLKK